MAGLNELEELYDYCYWTNGRFFEVVGRLTPEEFAQPVAGSYGSVRDTLVHMLSAEWGWLERCGGPKRGPALFAADYQSFSAVEDRWRDVEAWVRAFLANLSKEDLGRRITFAIANVPQRTMPLADLMRHGALYGFITVARSLFSFARSAAFPATSISCSIATTAARGRELTIPE